MITKTFVQMYHSRDTECRYYNWEDTSYSYEEGVAKLHNNPDSWTKGFRIVEKTFHPEDFYIPIRVIKTTMREYNWNTSEWEIKEYMEEN